MLGPKLKNVPGCVVKKSNPAGTVAALAWLAAAKISSALDKNALEFIRHLHAFADKFFRRLASAGRTNFCIVASTPRFLVGPTLRFFLLLFARKQSLGLLDSSINQWR
jgi:hypothetical protein